MYSACIPVQHDLTNQLFAHVMQIHVMIDKGLPYM